MSAVAGGTGTLDDSTPTNIGPWAEAGSSRRARFEALLQPLLGKLRGGALRFTRHEDDARDLLQETFLRAYRSFDSFEPGTNAKAWLFKIMYSVYVNAYHKRRRMPTVMSLEALEERYDRVLEIPDHDAYREVLQSVEPRWGADVADALGALPEPFRIAVMLVDVEELSYEDAATVADCPIGTLRSRLFRGRRALAVALHEHARQRGLA